MVWKDGAQHWFKEGKVHRDTRDADGHTLPAMITDDGDKFWYIDGEQHRTDHDAEGYTLPAAVYVDGTIMWYKHDVIHRDECDISTGMVLPATSYKCGTMEWYKNGRLHRTDRDSLGHYLPAVVVPSGRNMVYVDGKRITSNVFDTNKFRLAYLNRKHTVRQHITLYSDNTSVVWYTLDGVFKFTLDVTVPYLNDIVGWRLVDDGTVLSVEAYVASDGWTKAKF
jgi:hypothetical protein